MNFLITGANTGIGLATARALASRGDTVFLACRSRSGGSAAAASVGGRYLPLDLASLELARRYPAIHSYAVHPGVVASDIWRRVPWPVRPLLKRRMIPNDEGAATSVYCATSPEVDSDSGLYYDKCAPEEVSSVVTPVLGAELWERSSAWVGP